MENFIFSAVRVTRSDAEMIVSVYFGILFWFIVFSVSAILPFFTYNVLLKVIEQYREIFTRFSYYWIILNSFDSSIYYSIRFVIIA